MKELSKLALVCSLLFWFGCSESGEKPAATEAPAPSAQSSAPAPSEPVQESTVAQSQTPAETSMRPSEELPRTASPLTWIGLAGAVCLAGGFYLKLFLRWLR
jgi:hypothetical protein